MYIGILGAGTMGNGIAHVFAQYNYKVILVDLNEGVLEQALSAVYKNLNRQLQKKVINKSDVSKIMNNIITSTDMIEFKKCDLIVEAIKEDLALKSSIFKKLDNICNAECILASNTSSISINSLAATTNRPDKVIGMHFMNPVPIMKLVEIIKGKKTSKYTLNTIINISKNLNKIPIECNDSPGFVSNRILMPMINEAAHCFHEGVADESSIDSIMTLGMGHPMGPLKLADLIGIDVCVYILNVLFSELNDVKYRPCEVLVNMVENNKLGKKTGEGFYKYEL
jgi:3-hydroxybutyryl-CoA dehydrogenase